jgi:hypothetical protein
MDKVIAIDDAIEGKVMVPVTWQDNAVEFGRHESGWRLALLVACSVIPNDGHGIETSKNGGLHASHQAFAKIAGKSPTTIASYYEQWQYAASLNMVPDARTLKPCDVNMVDISGLTTEHLKQLRRELAESKAKPIAPIPPIPPVPPIRPRTPIGPTVPPVIEPVTEPDTETTYLRNPYSSLAMSMESWDSMLARAVEMNYTPGEDRERDEWILKKSRSIRKYLSIIETKIKGN